MCLPDVAVLHNDINQDIDILRSIFLSSFKELTFHGTHISVKRTPIHNICECQIEESLWHMISKEGKNKQRCYLPERAKTITWFEPVLRNAYDCCAQTRCWWDRQARSQRNGLASRLHIYFVKQNQDGDIFRYLIVLEDKRKYYQLVSAYPVTQKHKIDSLEKDIKNAYKVYEVRKTCSCS